MNYSKYPVVEWQYPEWKETDDWSYFTGWLVFENEQYFVVVMGHSKTPTVMEKPHSSYRIVK